MKLRVSIMLVMLLGLALSGATLASEGKHGKSERRDAGLKVTHGVSAGDVSSSSAVIWARANRESRMFVRVSNQGKAKSTDVEAGHDFTGKIRVTGLRANRHYHYRVWFADKNSRSKEERGSFKTAPINSNRAPLKVSWSGDFAGQNVCRDAKEGFPIFNSVLEERSDFFIGLGDMIYADSVCEAVGRYGNAQVVGDFVQSADLDNFWAHWRYAREDAALRQLLNETAYYGIWDDHEVVNDFGPLNDTRDTEPYVAGESLLPIGLQAFLDYNPILPQPLTPKRLYRNFRWGKHAEFFYLDNRQYRDHNLSVDSEERAKTMLGREQLEWLKEMIRKSNATWKIIVSSVPIAINTGFPPELGRDGWANDDANEAPTVDGFPQNETGFEFELMSIMETLRETNSNSLFITTDVHFAEVFRFTPFADAPEFQVHEVVIGPGNAGIFPNRHFDTTLGTESLFFFGPESSQSVDSWATAKKWFNYGTIEIDQNGKLLTKVKDTVGDVKYSLSLTP